MNAKKIRATAATAVAILILLYVGFYVVGNQASSFSNDGIKTETAMYGEISDTLQSKGFAIRDELVISDSYNGVPSYRVADGTRVSQGGVIADIYASENDAAAQNKIDRITREISNLQLLSKPVDFFASNPSLISSQIYSSLNDIAAEIRMSSFSQISLLKESLQTALNRKQIITGEETADDYLERIASLENERNQLLATAGDAISSITAPVAGYFISNTDGFENVMDIDNVKDITASQVRDLLDREQGTGLSSSVGKVCSEFNWYLVFIFNDNDMVKFENVTQVNLDIPFASTETIPAKVVAKNRDAQTKDTAVVLECSYMDSDIASVRNEMVQINVKTYSGILVSERALRFSDVEYTEEDSNGNLVTKVRENVKGVYVLYGGKLEFVQVFTDKMVNGYAVCKTSLSEEERASMVTDNTIALYDQVVVEGTDLFDGKLIR